MALARLESLQKLVSLSRKSTPESPVAENDPRYIEIRSRKEALSLAPVLRRIFMFLGLRPAMLNARRVNRAWSTVDLSGLSFGKLNLMFPVPTYSRNTPTELWLRKYASLLSGVTKFSFHGNASLMTDEMLLVLLEMPRLENVSISRVSITDDGLCTFSLIPTLRSLSLSIGSILVNGQNKPPNHADELFMCTKLRRLELSNFALPEQVALQISRLESVESLVLKPTNVLPDQVFQQLLKLRQLQYLEISGNISDNTIRDLCEVMPSLTHIHLDRCYAITDVGFSALFHFATLQVLEIRRSRNITGIPVASIAQLSSLKRLMLSECAHLPEYHFIPLLDLPALTELDVSGTALSDIFIAPLLVKGSKLSALNVSSCQLDDAAVKSILTSCPNVTSLNLSYNEISDVPFKDLSVNVPKLRQIKLQQTNITDCTCEYLSRCEQLELVEFMWSQVTDLGVVSLLEHSRVQEVIAQGCKRVTESKRFNKRKETGTWFQGGMAPLTLKLEW